MNRDTIKSDGYFAGTKATIEIGINLPLGSLSKILQPSILFGFSIDIPTTKVPVKLIGFNGVVYLTDRSNQFSYKIKDSIVFTKIIKAGFIGGMHYTHRTYINERYILDKIVGIGIGILSTNIEKNNIDKKNDQYYSLSALNLNAGVSLKRAISRNTRIGLRLLYNFTAYSLFNKQIQKDFGSNSLTTSLSATF